MSNNRPPSQANRNTAAAPAKPIDAKTPDVTQDAKPVTPVESKVQNPPPLVRAPKYIWLVKPSFTMGDARAYFTKESALEDFGQPLEKWTDSGHIMQIKVGPRWDPFECEWELEKIQVR